MLPFGRISAAQPNWLYRFGQAQPPAQSDAAAAQYAVSKMHLMEAHRITNGDDVLVAVIDSKIDTGHPDLAGVIADEYDALGTPGPRMCTAPAWPAPSRRMPSSLALRRR